MTEKTQNQKTKLLLNRLQECYISGSHWCWRYWGLKKKKKEAKPGESLGCTLWGNVLSILCPSKCWQYKVIQEKPWWAGAKKAHCLQSQTALPSGSCRPTNESTILGSWQMDPCLLRAWNLEQKAHNRFHIIMDLPEVVLLLYLRD